MSEIGEGRKPKTVKIDEGTLIDHVSAGKALKILKVLKAKEGAVILALNVPNEEIKVKDVVELRKRYLKEEEKIKVALLSPTATISTVKNHVAGPGEKIEIPNHLVDILKCPNPKCITNMEREPVKTSFTVINRKPLKIKCDYCDKIVKEEEIEKLL